MFTHTRKPALALGFIGLSTVLVAAHVRLVNPNNGNALFWDDPDDVSIVINSTGSDNVNDGSDETALRNAIDAWNDVTQTTSHLDENKNASQQARTDWESNSIHLMLFDENNSSGFFPGASGVVAITPISYFVPSGKIADADVIFNGKNFNYTTKGVGGRFDIQDVGTHELGHLLGLNHSGWAGATMYPYVDATVLLHRSLAEDDVRGLQHIAPNGTFGRITGVVKRASGGNTVEGAHVVARDANGRTAAARLSGSNGSFSLRSLPTGTYTVYARPLEGAVTESNLGAGYNVETDFEATEFGAFAVTAGSATAIGDVLVGDDVSVSLGKSTDIYPFRAVAGTTTTGLSIRGTGLVGGSTLTFSDPGVALSGIPTWTGATVQFAVAVMTGEAPGHVDVQVEDPGGAISILAAALEITPPDPGLTTVSPASGDAGGGTGLTVSGSGFRAGARVVIGNRIYEDGEPGGCTVVSPSAITLTTQSTVVGQHDVVVIDATGVEGRLANGFTAAAPVLASIFPVAGNQNGSTTVTLIGDQFIAGATVTINGVVQTPASVTVETASRIRLVTDAGAQGGPYIVVVENPDGSTAMLAAAFSYTNQPDPAVGAVAPVVVSTSGGETISVTGTDFTLASTVVFGADADTGQGGNPAANVIYVSPTNLQVLTPSLSSGTQTVMVRQTDTQQASVLASALTAESSGGGGGGGGGGGCGSVVTRPPTGSEVFANLAALALALALVRLHARRLVPQRVRV